MTDFALTAVRPRGRRRARRGQRRLGRCDRCFRIGYVVLGGFDLGEQSFVAAQEPVELGFCVREVVERRLERVEGGESVPQGLHLAAEGRTEVQVQPVQQVQQRAQRQRSEKLVRKDVANLQLDRADTRSGPRRRQLFDHL
ncbi:MAG: hypothetical protein KY433_05580, partial [Actinobacteria bacterium]|nr:hypothetical protein [Actinomycetota bacterium]